MSHKNIRLDVTKVKCTNSFFIASLPPISLPTLLDFVLFQCGGFSERSPSSQLVKSEFEGHPWLLPLLTLWAIRSQFLVSIIFWISPSIFYFSLSVATVSVLQWAPKCSCWIHSCHIKSVFHVASRTFWVILFVSILFLCTHLIFPPAWNFWLFLLQKENSLKWHARPFVDCTLPHLYCILVLFSLLSIFQKQRHFKDS